MSPSQDRAERISNEWRSERPDLDVTPQALIGRLHRLALALTDRLTEVYAAHGLSEGDFDVLTALRRVGDPFESTPSKIASATMVTTGAVTKRVDRLITAGLVARRRRDDDGRGRTVALTEEGRKLIDEAFTDHIANEHQLLAGLDSKQRQDLAELLRVWLMAVDPNDFE